ncbi:MAG: 3-hydroxyacyl-ACP dehydratase FabZ family protein [Pirellulales bacterium]
MQESCGTAAPTNDSSKGRIKKTRRSITLVSLVTLAQSNEVSCKSANPIIPNSEFPTPHFPCLSPRSTPPFRIERRFSFLDEIVEQSPERIVCRKLLTGEEFFYAGHYPATPITPGVLLCEACLQAGAVLIAALMPVDAGKVPVATRMNNVKFKRVVKPGDTIEIEAKLTERLGDAYFLTGKVTVAGKPAASLEFAVAQADAE